MSAVSASDAASAMPERTPYALSAPLPYVGDGDRWPNYTRYPVFGRRWLLGRSAVFGGWIGAFAIVTSIGLGTLAGDARVAALSGLHFFAGFMLICGAGPALGTLVRHAHWPLRRERWAMVVALLIGLVVAALADRWSSGYLESAMPDAKVAEVTIEAPASMSPEERMTIMFLHLLTNLAVYGALGGGFALRAYFRELARWRDDAHAEAMAALQAEKQRSDLHLGVLQAQVEPHFLFNTLASVRALVQQRPAQAEATLDALVAYLRASIPKLRDDEAALVSTLGQQLDLCAHYLEVMRLRTAGRLHYRIEADAALRECAFPPLLLLILVENAIKHGIEPKAGPGAVIVAADLDEETHEGEIRDGRTLDGKTLRVRIDDDGLGLLTGVGGGLGLTNLRAQLRTLYGDRASFRLMSELGGGTRAELRIPITGGAR